MKFNANQIRKIVSQAIDKSQYAIFTVYRPAKIDICGISKKYYGRPIKIKAKIKTVWCRKEGLIIQFTKCFANKKFLRFDCAFLAKDIRWIRLPANYEVLSQFFKKLPAGQAVNGDATRNRDL